MPRILIYSHDTYGLGNIRRMLTIAVGLTEADASTTVLIATGSPMLHAFRIPERIDYVKLPCLARNAAGQYGVKFLDMSLPAALDLRARVLADVAESFEPDIVLVDKKPLGLEGELELALDALARKARRPKVYLVLRDILDGPSTTSRIWKKNDYYRQIEDRFDGVLVAGSRDIFDVGREYAFPESLLQKIHYCGYLRRPGGRTARLATRARLGFGDAPVLLLQVGGGADGAQLISTWFDLLETGAADGSCKSWVICGPELEDSERRVLHERADGLAGVTLEDFNDDMAACLDASDAVVAMGGYNTVCEIMSCARPALIVPRKRPVREQWMRAVRMAKAGMVDCLDPDALSPARLGEAVRGLFDRGHTQIGKRETLEMDGLDTMCRLILATANADGETQRAHSSRRAGM